MRKSTHPLAITGTKEKLISLIPKLKELGYDVSNAIKGSNGTVLVTNAHNENGIVQFFDEESLTKFGRTVVSIDNEELVIALAAMVDDVNPYVGEYLNCKEELKQVLEVRSKDNWYWFGEMFLDKGVEEKNYYNPNVVSGTGIRKATKEELINHFMKQEPQRLSDFKLEWSSVMSGVASCKVLKEAPEITGYKLKPEFESFKQIKELFILDQNNSFEKSSISYAHAKKMCVLQLWFDPVYKKKEVTEIVTLSCEGGTFEIQVSKKGLCYQPEGTWINVDQLKGFLDAVDNLYLKTNIAGYHFTSPRPQFIDAGCKKKVPIKDWRNALYAYYKIMQ